MLLRYIYLYRRYVNNFSSIPRRTLHKIYCVCKNLQQFNQTTADVLDFTT